MRKTIFAIVDCNNFYVSAERLVDPKLEGKAVVVLSNNDGCAIARSEEAKQIGVSMGVPVHEIQHFINQRKLQALSSNYTLYANISNRIMTEVRLLVPHVEVYSIDETFLDLSHLPEEKIEGFCLKLRATILQNVGIPVSIGVASTKTLAKIANRYVKKHFRQKGVYFLDDDVDTQLALAATPVADIWGVGYRYAKLLSLEGIRNALDFSRLKPEWVKKYMKTPGLRTLQELNGLACIPLELYPQRQKNIMTSRSFGKSQQDPDKIKEAIANFAARCGEKLREQKSLCNMIQVSIETNRFREEPQYNNSAMISMHHATNITQDLIRCAFEAFDYIYKPGYNYKRAGVMVSEIVPEPAIQRNLFVELDEKEKARLKLVIEKMDEYNRKNGRDKIRFAAQGFGGDWQMRQVRKSPNCFTSWHELLVVKD